MTKASIIFTACLINLNMAFSQTSDKKETPKDTTRLDTADFQLTLITPLGSNGTKSHKTRNHVSVNIFGGANGAVDGVEVGGFVNVILHDVKGVQAAGFVNAVRKDVTGIQAAGFVNASGGNLNGLQFAGFVNSNNKDVKGGQISGFFNNNLGNVEGVQMAGFANYNNKNFKGIQSSGYFNVNRGNFKGIQLSGFANINGGNFEGLQASGFVNVAKKVKGFQLGVINIADSVDGASIGFCNIVKHGLHQVEISADELFYTNVSVRTGTHRFYNIFSAGLSSKPKGLLWQIGYGAGTSFAIGKNLRSDISISAHHVSSGLLYHGTSELYKIYWGVEYKLAKKCFVAMGPTLNIYWGDALQPDFAKKYSSIVPYHMLNETNTYGFNYKAWVGGRVAFRFL